MESPQNLGPAGPRSPDPSETSPNAPAAAPAGDSRDTTTAGETAGAPVMTTATPRALDPMAATGVMPRTETVSGAGEGPAYAASEQDTEGLSIRLPSELRTDDRPERRFGLTLLITIFGVLGIWSATAPIDSAAVAPAVVTVESARKRVQHPDGGIVLRILVREGDQVEAGQLLIELDDTGARTQLEATRGNLFALIAETSRLVAERDDLESVTFPEDLLERADDPRVKEAIEGETRLFQHRRVAQRAEIALLRERIAQLQAQIQLHESLQEGRAQRSAFYEEERNLLQGLANIEGVQTETLERIDELIKILEREQSEHTATIAAARVRIGESELRILQLESGFDTSVAERLREVQTRAFELRERVRSLEKTLEQTLVRAPVSGAVVNLSVHTEGGVVRAGEELLSIVPKGDGLIVEAQVSPQDVDRVFEGMQAEIRFTTFSATTTPVVYGRVVTLSADRLEDTVTRMPYFLARIQVTDESLTAVQKLTLLPGMPATVMINTGERTLLAYLAKPLTDRIATAFKED